MKHFSLPVSEARKQFEIDRADKSYCAKHGVPYFTDCGLCVTVEIRQILKWMANRFILDPMSPKQPTVESVVDEQIASIDWAAEEE